MGKVEHYRKLIQMVLMERAKLRSDNDPIEVETIFDTEHDHYQLVHTGWRDNHTRIYGCVLHLDLKGDKIWVQYDGSEAAIADQLATLGVPKQDIVLAYHAPNLRKFTEFAVN